MILDMTHKSKSFKDGVQFAWDSTSIKLAETCLRKYQLKMIQGWHPKGTGVHLRFGAHYATALEHYHKWRAEGQSHNDALRATVHEALVATWDRTDDAPEGAPWQSDHNAKTRENLIRTIVWYLEQFVDDPAKPIILSNGKPAVELSFTLPVSDDLLLVGHLDRLAEYADNIYVMDQKTTGSTISDRYFKQYSPDTQMSLYTYAGQAIWQVPVRGVIIDAAQIAVGFSRFERGFTFRTKGQLDEWFENTLYHIATAQRATREQYFPMNTTACNNFGGCEFREVCSRDAGARPTFLEADFEQLAPWDPLERR